MRPDLAIADIRMPPTHTAKGLDAAAAIRAWHSAGRSQRAIARDLGIDPPQDQRTIDAHAFIHSPHYEAHDLSCRK